MSGFDLHPEELLDRVRRGQASTVERERVQQHLQRCEACRFEHALLAQSTRDAAPHPGDGERARRIEQAAAAALAARGVLAEGASGKRTRRRRASALVAAAAVSSLATAAAAAVITQPAWLARMLPVQSTHAPAAQATPARTHMGRTHTRIEPAPPPSLAQPVVSETPALEQPAPSPLPRPSAARSAAELFAAANLARREHETGAAVRLYRELARRHPRSPEAAVSRVALGRLLLDRVSDARGALHEFDAYLADVHERALREDALIGRALALGRLGRGAEERAAWQALLSGFPGSAYAERARARIAELR